MLDGCLQHMMGKNGERMNLGNAFGSCCDTVGVRGRLAGKRWRLVWGENVCSAGIPTRDMHLGQRACLEQ